MGNLVLTRNRVFPFCLYRREVDLEVLSRSFPSSFAWPGSELGRGYHLFLVCHSLHGLQPSLAEFSSAKQLEH